MKRYQLGGLVVAAVMLLSLLSLMGCGSKGSVALGPMPPESVLPDPTARQAVIDLRAWVQNLKPEDAKTLNDTGRLFFFWPKLQASYPEAATLIDKYAEAKRLSRVAKIKEQKQQVVAQLAVHYTPVGVTIESRGWKKYSITIRNPDGIDADLLPISQ
jgi:hypothetical protein